MSCVVTPGSAPCVYGQGQLGHRLSAFIGRRIVLLHHISVYLVAVNTVAGKEGHYNGRSTLTLACVKCYIGAGHPRNHGKGIFSCGEIGCPLSGPADRNNYALAIANHVEKRHIALGRTATCTFELQRIRFGHALR